MSSSTCLFHIPYRLDPERNPSAPQIRPIMLRDAFRELGLHVLEISGTSDQRKVLIDETIKEIKAGRRFDFLYSECATIPTLLTDPDHFPHGGFADFRLFRECRAFEIPSGLFYRDIYWMFPEFDQQYGALRARFMKALYRCDLRVYSRHINTLFVPSDEFGTFMKSSVNIDLPRMSPLPPGCAIGGSLARAGSVDDGRLNILYVGGISSEGMYDMRELFAAVSSLDFAQLTVCIRKKEWDSAKAYYSQYLSPNIKIVHRSGDDLETLYQWADIGTLLFHPNEYRSFAMPFKMFEYMGMCLPMIVSSRTLVASLVESENWGWSCNFEALSISRILTMLHENKKLLRDASQECLKSRIRNTWKARASQVCRQLEAGNAC